jgi:hypothetical protein
MGRTLSSDSANVTALPASPTGFTAGDYVYRTTAGYGAVPNAALATGMFDFGAIPSPVYSATATTSNELTYVEQLGGSQGSQVAAQLTNSNIVYAYATTTSFGSAATVNFRIETTSGTPVVAQTSTTMTANGTYGVSVIALPAGGFAIVCTSVVSGSAYNLSIRFYNADGTVATGVLSAGATITGLSTSTSRLKIQALTDGSVVIGYINNTTFELRKVTTAGFDATFGTSGVVTVVTRASATQYWDFITDSSNNIQVIFANATTAITMRRYNSSGVQQTTSNVSPLVGVQAAAIVLSSDGTIRGILQDSTGITTITWNGTTAALGTRIITSATPPGAGVLGAFAQGASGGYVVFYNAFISGSSGAFGLFFQAFSSSNIALAAATRVNSASAVNYRNQLTPIVVSGNTRVYFGVFQANAVGYTLDASSTASPMGIVYFAYSNTTYALVGVPTVNYNFGSQGPFSLGTYMRGVSTAATARFTIATTGTYGTTTNTLGATLIPKTSLDSGNAAFRIILAPLPNGEFVAVWVRHNTGETFISKYSVTGVLQVGPVSVGTGGGGNGRFSISVATFANGNILVTYNDATLTTLRFRIYTPSLTVVTSGDIDTGDYAIVSNAPVACASFGDGDHIAVLYNDSSGYLRVKCVQSTGTVTARLGTGLSFTTPWAQPQVIGFKSNAFAIAAFANDSSNSVYGCFYRKTGATTFVSGASSNFNNTMNNIGNAFLAGSPIATPGTAAYYIGANSGATAYKLISLNPLSNTNTLLSICDTTGLFSGLSLGGSYAATVGYTATGLPVLVANRAATSFLTLSVFTSPMDGNNAFTSGVTTTQATSSSSVNVSAIPHIGDAILIGYIDSNNFPAFTSIVASPFTVNTTLTAGTDISTSTLTLTPETGYSLQGISVTAAASGNSGLVQGRGTAALNSNYSAATPATTFDFRNPLTFGTNGLVIGRTVIMGNN